ncbi:MAG: tRNA (N6-threonylcarbamoyladenosine(37)-N6)-methyltransferase TrmO, partial [Bacteroidales bacterium]|nr:tRNA (N6-threonylcarbamoyladenosine(37)-N6)-methyltransferase TrmO [Bacteroidales bacterium]
MGKEITPVAVYHSPLEGKFGVPRQSGVAADLRGEVRLEGRYRHPDALRGLEGFDYVWLIWGFSLSGGKPDALTVRPPRLGGNTRVGVFASRSPFRPNGLGLSCVKIESVDPENGVILVSGADLADGTPVYDIKPYVEYADSR